MKTLTLCLALLLTGCKVGNIEVNMIYSPTTIEDSQHVEVWL